MTTEEVTGKKFPHTAAAGIPSMEQRITYLEGRIKNVFTRLEAKVETGLQVALQRELQTLKNELAEAELRLKEYRQQHEGRN